MTITPLNEYMNKSFIDNSEAAKTLGISIENVRRLHKVKSHFIDENTGQLYIKTFMGKRRNVADNIKPIIKTNDDKQRKIHELMFD